MSSLSLSSFLLLSISLFIHRPSIDHSFKRALGGGGALYCVKNFGLYWSKTQKRLKERFLIGRNGTKRAKFGESPLFQATHNIKTEKQTIISTFSCVGQVLGGLRKEKGTRLTKSFLLMSCVFWIFFFRTLAVNYVSDFFGIYCEKKEKEWSHFVLTHLHLVHFFVNIFFFLLQRNSSKAWRITSSQFPQEWRQQEITSRISCTPNTRWSRDTLPYLKTLPRIPAKVMSAERTRTEMAERPTHFSQRTTS